jgi:formamidopyrimidine-DNA glycosylase
MPELPDITAYLEALAPRVLGEPLERVRLASPFLLRTFDPPLSAVEGRRVEGLRRLGKRIVVSVEGDLHLVLHLMIAGRLRWREEPPKAATKRDLAVFEFETGHLLLTEAASKKRASLHVVEGVAALAAHDPGGVEPLAADLATFRDALSEGNHTLKRALTDPRRLSGIGNAFSDEILHRARLSPFKLTGRLDDAEHDRLHRATVEVLGEWIDRTRAEVGDGFPDKVTSLRPEMAVHGRYGRPCPVCGAPVQRVVYAETEANYCPGCQTGGRLLADRALSRLLHDDWPKTLDELEARRAAASPDQSSPRSR